ncbi:restriction endonuclease subunit S [Sunxiuqinia sp. sy24]|uniref:restriction endonuclease subunit S n=1 Tax=Sunxiuqinia sp. sy24 TaxID=3461495 RepID=UPI0040461C05
MKTYEIYSNTDISWIGRIPKGWTVRKFGHVSYMKGRIGWQGLKQSEFNNNPEDPFLITGMNFKDGVIRWDEVYHISHERYNEAPEIQLKENDLLFTKDGTIGKLLYVDKIPAPNKASLNSHLLVLRPFDEYYDTRYMYYQLAGKHFKFYIDLVKTGTTFFGISQEAMSQCKLIFPPKKEQIQIASFLDRKTAQIDKLINEKEELLKLLAEKRTAIITQAVTKGLHPDAEMKDSGIDWLGQIPKHWEVIPLKYQLKSLNRRRIPLSAEERSKMSKEFPYYGASGIIDYVEDYIFDEDLILIAEDGANLLSRSTPLAFIATGKYWVNNHAHILSSAPETFDYWSNLLCIIDYTPWITGAAQPKLTKENLGGIPLPKPPQEEQLQISDFINRELIKYDPLIEKAKLSINQLKEYRGALITAAVTGQIDVRKEVIDEHP